MVAGKTATLRSGCKLVRVNLGKLLLVSVLFETNVDINMSSTAMSFEKVLG